MDLSESTRLLLNRITEIEPDIASKVIGYLLLKDYGDRDMIRLAHGPDGAICALIDEVKSALPFIKLSPRTAVDTIPNSNHFRLHSRALSPSTLNPVASPFQTQQQKSPFWDTDSMPPPPSVQYTPRSPLDPRAPYGTHLPQLLNLEDLNACYATTDVSASDATVLGPRTTANRRSASYIFPPEPPSPKACHYFYKGYCKHGINCRYLHDQQPVQDGYTLSSVADIAANDDHEFVPGSLEKLEVEIAELLRSRRGQPISIAMLPMMYQEEYGKVLQAEGYLTESQRHGKAGYNLTKLLARMKGSIRLIDRPHGQHSIILAEDATRSFEYRGERNDPGNVVSSSQQIYLTFPAESTFTEDDIADYFSHFGPVQAVRIPAQQKRMFGFVTFVHPDTVQLVFAKGNPHYICDARVLVKPYREKTRKSCDKIEIPIYFHPPYMDLSPEFQPVPKLVEPRVLLRKQLEHEQLLDTQRRLAQMQLASQPYGLHHCMGYDVERLMRYQEEHNQTLLTEDFSCGVDDVTNELVDEEKSTSTNGTCCDKASQIDLPESPFASL